MDHWSVSATNGLSTKKPQRKLVPSIISREADEKNKGERSPEDSCLFSLSIFWPWRAFPSSAHTLGWGEGEGGWQASNADEKRRPGSYRRCRGCWRKESLHLPGEARSQHFLFSFFAFYVFPYYRVFSWTQVQKAELITAVSCWGIIFFHRPSESLSYLISPILFLGFQLLSPLFT